MKSIQEHLEKILLTWPTVNNARIVNFKQKIDDLQDLFYDEIEDMRLNEYDASMDEGIDFHDQNE